MADGDPVTPELFRDEEIDLSVFLAMTEEDLRRLGVRTVGGRKKLLMLIQSLSGADKAF